MTAAAMCLTHSKTMSNQGWHFGGHGPAVRQRVAKSACGSSPVSLILQTSSPGSSRVPKGSLCTVTPGKLQEMYRLGNGLP